MAIGLTNCKTGREKIVISLARQGRLSEPSDCFAGDALSAAKWDASEMRPYLEIYARGAALLAASETIFLNVSVDAFTTASGPVILTKTLPSALSRIAPQSA